MQARTLYFTGPREVAVRERPVPEPDDGEVRVRTERSAISSGTELLIYRNEASSGVATDETIDTLDGELSYPLQYGYSAVGRVTAVGDDVDTDWRDRRVFAFHPHASHFLATPGELVPVEYPPERAAFLANAEAATNFVMDGRPRIGERVVVFGQGTVGLLTTALLAEFPLESLVTVDPDERRRTVSMALGADAAVESAAAAAESLGGDGADVTFEVSGNPEALDDALDVTGYAGEVVLGSWYGTKPVTLDLDSGYHRSHIRIRSSQVSRVDPDHAGRWDKDRRLDLVRRRLADVDTDPLITHEFPLDRAGEAYTLLDRSPGETLGVQFTYG
jgi:2-desacetyl-2-hydroxyethyl bacteriochlorophyllide A dehydrogenase